jgi:hypothetical protein
MGRQMLRFAQHDKTGFDPETSLSAVGTIMKFPFFTGISDGAPQADKSALATINRALPWP